MGLEPGAIGPGRLEYLCPPSPESSFILERYPSCWRAELGERVHAQSWHEFGLQLDWDTHHFLSEAPGSCGIWFPIHPLLFPRVPPAWGVLWGVQKDTGLGRGAQTKIPAPPSGWLLFHPLRPCSLSSSAPFKQNKKKPKQKETNPNKTSFYCFKD